MFQDSNGHPLPGSAFKTIVDEHGQQVLNLALRILSDPETAQDVHQEVFLAVWRRWHTFNGQTNWKAYLYRATVRKAIELAKRSRKMPLADASARDPAFSERPDARVRTAELQEKLAGCLAELPQRQADVFVLSRIEGLSHHEIAEILGCSQKTVRVHLYRAMKRLARSLAEYLK